VRGGRGTLLVAKTTTVIKRLTNKMDRTRNRRWLFRVPKKSERSMFYFLRISQEINDNLNSFVVFVHDDFASVVVFVAKGDEKVLLGKSLKLARPLFDNYHPKPSLKLDASLNGPRH
jgi:hypothetical protein